MRRSGSPREEGPIRRERGKGGTSTTRLVHGIQGMEKAWTSRGSADGNGNGSPCCAELARSSRKTVRPIAMLARTPPETWSRGRGKILCYAVIQRERQGLACTWKSDRGHQRSVDYHGAIARNENFNNARSTKKPCHRTFMKKEQSLCSRKCSGDGHMRTCWSRRLPCTCGTRLYVFTSCKTTKHFRTAWQEAHAIDSVEHCFMYKHLQEKLSHQVLHSIFNSFGSPTRVSPWILGWLYGPSIQA